MKEEKVKKNKQEKIEDKKKTFTLIYIIAGLIALGVIVAIVSMIALGN